MRECARQEREILKADMLILLYTSSIGRLVVASLWAPAPGSVGNRDGCLSYNAFLLGTAIREYNHANQWEVAQEI